VQRDETGSVELEPFRLIHGGPRLQLCAWRELLVQRWSENGNVGDIDDLLRCHREFIARHRQGETFSMSHIRVPKLVAPAAEMRAPIQTHQVLVSEHTCGSVVVLDVDGFAASIVYGITSAAALVLPRPKIPNAMVRTLGEGFAFYARKRTGKGSVDAAALARRYADFQRELALTRP
jgi:hypothetical protein